jgi:serine/threonine-protein kinase
MGMGNPCDNMTAISSAGKAEAAVRPTQFGRFSIVREIGRGGMATVYEAVHGGLRKRVAIKVMHVDVREKPNAAERFFREARAAAQIRHHHIVNVFDVGTEGTTPYIVMDLVEGTDLAEFLSAKGKVSVRQATELFLPILSAVWSAHRAGIVHRDLKPSNILVSEFPRGVFCPVVVDFGISKTLDDGDIEPLTRSESLLGTPHYMAPEQIHGAKFVTECTDQYAIGVMLYECVTGKRPFEGQNAYDLMHAIANLPVTKPTQIDPNIPREFERIVLRAMQRDASKRFPSVHALGCALLSFAGNEGWSRWGLEFTGRGLGNPSPGRGSLASALQSNRVDTPVDDREGFHVNEPRKRGAKPRLKVAALVAAGISLGVVVATRALSRRTDALLAVAPQDLPGKTVVASSRAPNEPAAALGGEPSAAEVATIESPALAAPKPTVRPRSGPRTVSVAPSSTPNEKPAVPAEPRIQRERGPNGALILE